MATTSTPSAGRAKGELASLISQLSLVRESTEFPWHSPRYSNAYPLPRQGFKLHLSATPDTAAHLLSRVAPVLVRRRVAFKVVGCSDTLESLNMGHFGYSQVGKFITIYPCSNEAAVTLSEVLLDLTADMTGPPIPSDRRIHPSRVVHYRYGSFVLPADDGAEMTIVSPAGETLVDERDPATAVPHWIEDPIAERHHLNCAKNNDSFRDFAILHVYRQRPRGGVYLAIDMRQTAADQPRIQTVILKEGRACGEQRAGGLDARQRLDWEAAVLQRLEPSGVTPKLLGVHYTPSANFLILQPVAAASLQDHIRNGTKTPPLHQILFSLVDALEAIHLHGVFHCDLSPANVCIAEDERLFLIDFENAIARDRPDQIDWDIGTVGCFPSKLALSNLSIPWSLARDLYAVGSITLALTRPHWFTSLLDHADSPPVNYDIPEVAATLPSSLAKFVRRATLFDEPFESLGHVINWRPVHLASPFCSIIQHPLGPTH